MKRHKGISFSFLLHLFFVSKKINAAGFDLHEYLFVYLFSHSSQTSCVSYVEVLIPKCSCKEETAAGTVSTQHLVE